MYTTVVLQKKKLAVPTPKPSDNAITTSSLEWQFIVSCHLFSARCVDRTNRRAIAMMFIRLSVCLKRACIVIIRCTLARIQVYGCILDNPMF